MKWQDFIKPGSTADVLSQLVRMNAILKHIRYVEMLQRANRSAIAWWNGRRVL